MSLDDLPSIYFPSECNVDEELFYPVSKCSKSMDCMVGYFTSGSLKELARAIVAYLAVENSEPMRLIISPSLSDADMQAIRDGLETDKNILPLLFPDFTLDEDTLRSKAVIALLYLISQKKIELRVAVKTSGILHTKCWLFETPQGELAIHGSGNATQGGLSNNFEQLILSREWLDASSKEIVGSLRERFNKLWNNVYAGIFTIKLNSKTLKFIETTQSNKRPLQELQSDLERLIDTESSVSEHIKKGFKIPSWLRYKEGRFSHQGEAIEAWRENSFNGILSIATGGGKTLTSLVGATLLNHIEDKLLVVIAVPTKPLLEQWKEEVQLFSVNPDVCNGIAASSVRKIIKSSLRNLRLGISDTECIIVTHEGLKSETLAEINKLKKSVKTLLIADEVHNLGSIGFRERAPKYFDFKLGLSATHERQYDVDGSNFLLSYFGGLVYEFGLERAIGNCLVPYRYFPQTIQLSAEEQDDFADLTVEIKKLAYAINSPEGSAESERLKILCMKRRKIIETATNKVVAFRDVVESKPAMIKRTLVFCSDKDPAQLKDVNNILNNNSIYFNQVTQLETSSRKKLKSIISDFNDGKIDALTSMRVLDEGFNVPQTENAFLLASNTVKRQWVQRLGRVLRLSPGTGKKEAVIYDFVALPSLLNGSMDGDLKSLLKGEYARVRFFTELASNSAAPDGGLALASKLIEMMEKA